MRHITWCNTIYHESFKAEKFHRFSWFLHGSKIFLYEILRWRCSNMDLRESMWDSVKVFYKVLHLQLAAKCFCFKTFIAYCIRSLETGAICHLWMLSVFMLQNMQCSSINLSLNRSKVWRVCYNFFMRPSRSPITSSQGPTRTELFCSHYGTPKSNYRA